MCVCVCVCVCVCWEGQNKLYYSKIEMSEILMNKLNSNNCKTHSPNATIAYAKKYIPQMHVTRVKRAKRFRRHDTSTVTKNHHMNVLVLL